MLVRLLLGLKVWNSDCFLDVLALDTDLVGAMVDANTILVTPVVLEFRVGRLD